MTTDFRADQVRLTKLIASGSYIIVYPSGAASDLAGTINTSVFPQTGFGSDVFLFVSGGNTRNSSTRGVVMLGGQMVASGAVFGLAGFSGSLTKLNDGTSYLIASGGISITTGSNGAVTIYAAATAGSSFTFNSTSLAYSGSSGLTGTSNLTYNDNTGLLRLLTSSIQIEQNIASSEDMIKLTANMLKKVDPTTETTTPVLYVEGANGILSGSGGGITLQTGNAGFLDAFPGSGGTFQVYAGSGSKVQDTVVQVGGTGGSINLNSGVGGESTGTARGGSGGTIQIIGGAGGPATNALGGDGSSVYLYAGEGGSGSLGSGTGGNVLIKSGDGNFLASSGDSGYISIDCGYRTAPNNLSLATVRIDPSRYAKNVLIGYSHLLSGSVSDAYFIVTGSALSKSLFIGDVVSSGSTKAMLGFSGSLTTLSDGTSYLIAGSNITITSASNGAVTIAGSGGSVPAFNSTSIAYSGSSGLTGDAGLTYNNNDSSMLLSGAFTITNGIMSASRIDTLSGSGTSVLTLTHNGGTGVAGIASDVTFRMSNGAGTVTDGAVISSTLSTATNGAEVSTLDIKTRTAGAATRRVFKVYGSGGISVGSATNMVDPGDGGIVIPLTSGLYINSGGTNYSAIGVFGGATIVIGSGAWNVQLNAYTLSISAGQGMSLSNGWFAIAATAGFRRINSATSNADVSPALARNIVNMTGLTATRTVTLPAATDGVLMRVMNGDGTATNGIKVVVSASGGAKINGSSLAHTAIEKAYGFTEYWSDGTNWNAQSTNANDTSTSFLEFMSASGQGLKAPTEFSANQTIGTKFRMNRKGVTCTGFRMYWSGSNPRDFVIKIWSGSTMLSYVSAALTGAVYFTGSFTASITLERSAPYYISFRETTGTYYYPAGILSSDPIFDFKGYGNQPIHLGDYILAGFDFSAAGDTAPTSGGGGNAHYIEPLFGNF